MLLSMAKVASKCASWGEAARRRRGGEGARVCGTDFEGEDEEVGEAARLILDMRVVSGDGDVGGDVHLLSDLSAGS